MDDSIDSAAAAEIVQVISECRLLDARSEKHIYWRRDGLGLAPGYYLIKRDGAAVRRVFNEDTQFRGPYRSRADAQAAKELENQRREAWRSRESASNRGGRGPVR